MLQLPCLHTDRQAPAAAGAIAVFNFQFSKNLDFRAILLDKSGLLWYNIQDIVRARFADADADA